MEETKHASVLHIKTKGFRGVEFSIDEEINGEVVKQISKTINVLSAMEMADIVKDYQHTISHHIHTMNYYRHYDENIEEYLDKEEKNRDPEEPTMEYEVGGNYAFFLETKHDTGHGVVYADNHKAAKLIKTAYKKAYPDAAITFDPELSHCYAYAKTREEAKRFMLWMWEHYIKPWVEENKEGWDDFVEVYEKADKTQKALLNIWQ